jgi:hypothetical protein
VISLVKEPDPKKARLTFVFKATPSFWNSYNSLTSALREEADEAFRIFRKDPFDPRLRTHKINMLSARYSRNVFSARVASNLRSVFYIEGETVVSFDIGTHDIYK